MAKVIEWNITTFASIKQTTNLHNLMKYYYLIVK